PSRVAVEVIRALAAQIGILYVHYWTQAIPNPVPNTRHMPSGSRHCVWTLRGNGRLNRFPRSNNKFEPNNRPAGRSPKANTSNLYRCRRADVRRGSQAPKVQPKSWESEG